MCELFYLKIIFSSPNFSMSKGINIGTYNLLAMPGNIRIYIKISMVFSIIY